MTPNFRLTLAAFALAAGVSVAGAQTAQDHTAHHPADQDAGQVQTRPEAMPSGPMARHAAKPGPGMKSGRDMMQMMTMMQMMRGSMMGMPPIRHIEGQIAFYKAELRITDAQAAEWNAFADTLRAVAANRMGATAPPTATTAPEQLERGVAALSARLEAMKSVLSAARPLYAVLSDDQKRTADEFVAEHTMGMQSHGMKMP